MDVCGYVAVWRYCVGGAGSERGPVLSVFFLDNRLVIKIFDSAFIRFSQLQQYGTETGFKIQVYRTVRYSAFSAALCSRGLQFRHSIFNLAFFRFICRCGSKERLRDTRLSYSQTLRIPSTYTMRTWHLEGGNSVMVFQLRILLHSHIFRTHVAIAST